MLALKKGPQLSSAESKGSPEKLSACSAPRISLAADVAETVRHKAEAIWLTGIERSLAATNSLLGKILSANHRVKVVIMAGSQKPEDIVAALKAGACGYVPQDISGETLLKALELIARGELSVHPQLVPSETADTNGLAADNLDEDAAYLSTVERPVLTLPSQPRLASAGAKLEESAPTSDVPSLSRREMLILRMLMQGASNKTIALKLGITKSTVKVHMKAILRKLRLQNRTQAAIWARNNIDETRWPPEQPQTRSAFNARS